VIAGIFISVIGLTNTLTEINLNTQKQKQEAVIRSHELFLNGVVDKIGGVKIFHNKPSASFDKSQENNAVFVEAGRESYSNEIQEAANAASVSLVKKFPELYTVAEAALKKRLDTVGDNPQTRKYYDQLLELRGN
jgi:hypothetical protein